MKKVREVFVMALSEDCFTPKIALDVHKNPWKPNERVRIIVERIQKKERSSNGKRR